MKKGKKMELWRFGLKLALLCICSIPQLVGAAAVPIPTSPTTGHFGAGETTPTPDYYTTPNWANSPPLAKFVDTLPGLDPAGTNNLGQFLPVAVPDTETFPGSDYYIIKLRDYTKQMHSDLTAGTKLRGYVQLLPDGVTERTAPNYLGPIIVATKDRPIRLKFVNALGIGTAGDLFIPVDESVMGAGPTPTNGVKYTQNRANIHLHGGRTPWISDGTPHQWITPAGETNIYKAGVSLQNVPDMCFAKTAPYNAIPRAGVGADPDCLTGTSDPGPGAATYYFTNQQSTRLMFYHDHAFGITRLNVYAGEAAGYVITDPVEQDLVDRGIIPGDRSLTAGGGTSYGGMIPLIIQDKTFVNTDVTVHPSPAATGTKKIMTTLETDPLWRWGRGTPDVNGVSAPTTGDLWLPHVYMPAQMPEGSSTGGVNPYGRWMYGPWFFPATHVQHGPVDNPYYDPNCGSLNPFELAQCTTPGQPKLIPGTPNVSMGMEAFQDSVVVNGTAFPTLTVDPKPYRFRILNAASDRFQNLSFYVADATASNLSPDARLTGTPAQGADTRNFLRSNQTEVKMTTASAANALANNWPADWPVDGREEMVPDPGNCVNGVCPNLGPSFIQIGTEGGFLPSPVVIPPQPITYITDPTAFWVGVVDKMGLAIGPAERADVIVDFSAYAGQTLILYNDAPAAWPARVPGYDYFTDITSDTASFDMRDSGGYGTGGTFNVATGAWEGGTGPLPGYAPNTRTVMQVIVKGSPGSGTPFAMTALENEFTSAAPASTTFPAGTPLFQRSQDPIIVGQAAYSSAYPNSSFPANFPWEGVNQINDDFLQFVTVAGEPVKKMTEPKGIHDEMGASFDPEYGRMSGNLAMQIPNPTTVTAVLNLYAFSDVPTEVVANSTTLDVQVLPNATPGLPGTIADGTQIWKISHNGVDTHPIHFHIFDVQLVNRVGWDGQLKMPEPNELGWKDTVKISPLMDTIVAVRPRAPALPFGIPKSLRQLNPAIPIDSDMSFNGTPTDGSNWFIGNGYPGGPANTPIYGFNSVDPATGQAYIGTPTFPYPAYKGIVTNVMYDFGWEYVWHCHILSHEEMDMMRPIVLKVDTALPPAFAVTPSDNGGNTRLTWTDPTQVTYSTNTGYGDAANEVGYNVYRSTSATSFPLVAAVAPAVDQINGTKILPANSTRYDDSTAFGTRNYLVEAFNASGSTYAYTAALPAVTVEATGGPTFAAPATVPLVASVTAVTDAGLTISNVEFYDGTTLLGSDLDAAGGYTFSWTPVVATLGAHSVTAKVYHNGVGGSFTSAPYTVTINSSGAPLSAVIATAPATYMACESITLDGSSSEGLDRTYQWIIDGVVSPVTASTLNIAANSFPATISPYSINHTVTLTVTIPGTGEKAVTTKTFAVTNANPVASHGGAYTVGVGGTLLLDGTATDADTCSTMSYAWDLDNKNGYEFTIANPSVSYSALLSVLGLGTHPIKLKVTDLNGGTATVTTTLTLPYLPVAVTLGAPVGAIGNIPMPTYSWTQDPNATSYNFYLTNSSGGVLLNTASVAATCLSGTCSYTPAESLTADSYTWYVQAVNSIGVGPWGTGQVFSVVVPFLPVAVTLGTPVGTIGNTPLPTYNWTQDPNATSYNVYLKNSSGGVLLSTSSVAATCLTGTCSYTPAMSLTTDSYTWYVQAENSVGAGPWGTGQDFSVVLPFLPVAVTLGAPVGAIGDFPLPTYSWTQDPNATSYNFYLKNSSGGVLLSTSTVAATCLAGTCSYTPAKSLTTDSYTWYVQAVNPIGAGPWGTGQDFSASVASTPPGLISQIGPTGSEPSALPTYSWNVIAGAKSYNFYLENSGKAVLLNTDSIAADCTTVPGVCSVTPAKSVPAGDVYTWYVQAANSAGAGSWGAGMSFSRP